MKVYQAINAVQTELAKVGISKSSRNNQGSGYNFRGIDAVYNVLSSIMAQNGLCIIPRMLTRTCEERTSKSGGALFYVTVEAEFDLVSAEDGSKHTARTFGEAMDSGDKATNKAMSAAYKYMALQTFAIPTEGDNDADAHTHEVAIKKPTLDAKRLQGAIEKILAGQYTTVKLLDTFDLTQDQIDTVDKAIANA
jgi:ERF superfamily